MNKFTDETPIAMLTVGQLKEILGNRPNLWVTLLAQSNSGPSK